MASCSGNAVAEIDRTINQVVQTLTDVTYNFDCPDALVFDGTNIWVANKLSSSITEPNATTGEWVQSLTGAAILNPNALAFDSTNIWVSDDSQNGDVGSFLSEFIRYRNQLLGYCVHPFFTAKPPVSTAHLPSSSRY